MKLSAVINERVLLTGGTGFIGKNILPQLSELYEVLSPRRAELDLSDSRCVESYLGKRRIDYLVHCAIADPAKEADAGKRIYEDTLGMFDRLSVFPFKKIVFIGSGAEYDKSKSIDDVREEDLPITAPIDEYGRVKYELTCRARRSENIFNVRIFGCYGPGEPECRFLRHAVTCCLNNEPITIRRDCRFSYVNVSDLGLAIMRLMSESPCYHDYNLCGGRSYLLSELADLVRRIMKADVPIQILQNGFANAYTGSDRRFLTEFRNFSYKSIEDGIVEEIEWLKGLTR